MPCSYIMVTEMLLFLFRLLVISLLCPKVSSPFLSNLRGSPKIDFPLSMFSLAKTVLTSLFSELTLLAGETNIVILEEAVLGEEKSYPKPILSEADF